MQSDPQRMNTRREHTKFWRDPHVHNVELLHATYLTHAFAPHSHEGFAIGVIDEGVERFSYRHIMHVAPAGSVVVVSPGEVHTGEAATEHGWSYRMLYPAVNLIQRAASQIQERTLDLPFFRLPVLHDPYVAGLLRRAHVASEEDASAIERESRLLWALAHLVARHAADPPAMRILTPERERVERVRSYIDEHYTDNVLLDQLAALVNLSPFHLLRMFRNEVGLPPHAYLTQARVRHAQQLIATGTPIGLAAADAGFTDQSHLTKHFKRFVGVTPGQYAPHRKNVQDTERLIP